MTVGSGAHIQVSNHSQDQCACMSGVFFEYESVHVATLKMRKYHESNLSARQKQTFLSLSKLSFKLHSFPKTSPQESSTRHSKSWYHVFQKSKSNLPFLMVTLPTDPW